MTAQLMDTIELDGETWSICEMTGASAVPTSRALGFRTTAEHTANWRGRVDRFGLDAEGRLVLLEVRATLANPGRAQGFAPPGATRIDEDERTVRFCFKHRLVPLTGRVVAGGDFDSSLYVHMGIQAANRFRRRVILQFLDGQLVGEGFEEGTSPNPELPAWKLYVMLLGFGVLVMLGIVLGYAAVRVLGELL